MGTPPPAAEEGAILCFLKDFSCCEKYRYLWLCWYLLNGLGVQTFRIWPAGIFISLFLLGLSCWQRRRQPRI